MHQYHHHVVTISRDWPIEHGIPQCLPASIYTCAKALPHEGASVLAIMEASACSPAQNVLFEAFDHSNVNRQQHVLTCVVGHEILPRACTECHDQTELSQ